MPRPGEAPIRAPSGAEHGTSADLARLQQVGNPQPAPQAQPQQQGPGRPRQPAPPPPEEDPNADLNDGYDEALFGPTMRPSEPVTAGAPFGPGPSFVQRPDEDERSFMLRVADALDSTASAALRPYIDRIRNGA